MSASRPKAPSKSQAAYLWCLIHAKYSEKTFFPAASPPGSVNSDGTYVLGQSTEACQFDYLSTQRVITLALL